MKLATLCYVINKTENSTLMIHRVKKENDYHEGKWNGLGGKFEQGETPEECAVREVQEESGLIMKNPRLHGFLTFPMFDEVDDWYVFVFTASEFEGKLITSNEGNLKWIKNEELFSLNLWEGDKIFLEWVFQNKPNPGNFKFFSAKFNYNNGKFLDYKVSFY